MTISAEQIPILHEDCTFGYLDEHGDLVGALGRAEYYANYTILMHVGSVAVGRDLRELDITQLKFGGGFEDVERLEPTKDGYARFIIRRGYGYFYPRDEVKGEIGGVDAWTALHPWQMYLGECETLSKKHGNELLRKHGFKR